MATETALPETDAGWNRNVTTALTIVGFVGMCSIAFAGFLSGPINPPTSAIERWALHARPHGTALTITATTSVVVGMVLVIGAWVVIGLLLRKGASLRPLIRISILWSLPLLLAPSLYSRDAYSYAALGRMVNLHWDPYQYGPSVLGKGPFLAPVSGIWRTTPSPYGPLFLRLTALAERFSGGSVFTSVLLLRLLAVVGVVLIGLALPKLAEAAGKDAGRALWLAVCNPLVLIHFIGGAHNDALMVGLLLCGLALWVMKHPALGIVVCMLAAAIKAPAAIGAAFIAVEAARALPPGKRLFGLGKFLALGAAAFAAITAVTGMGFGWIKALSVPGQNHVLLTPTVFVAHFVSDVVGHDDAVLAGTRALGTLLTALGIAFLLWKSDKLGAVRGTALALALLVALGPVVLPWYALWAVIILAASGRRIERGFAIFASLVLTIVVQPDGSAMPDVVLYGAVLVLAGVLVAIMWKPVRSWIRRDLAPAIDEYRRGGRAARVLDLVKRARPSAVDSRAA